MINRGVKEALEKAGMFSEDKVYAVFDGQFGSTGKGLMSSVLAECFGDRVKVVTSNAGPNSGHTSYFGGEKIVLTQLPTFAVVSHRMGHECDVFMNGGAVIDPDTLAQECQQYIEGCFDTVFVSNYASVVDSDAIRGEIALKLNVGSTGKGTGAAISRKVMRDKRAVVKGCGNPALNSGPILKVDRYSVVGSGPAFMEVSQGFSLGLNQGFYPYCTSRECTVSQGLADAGLAPSDYGGGVMCVRTFPIRVGGNSGPGYDDQIEIKWDDIGVEPELTTVTKKERRIFTWSPTQYERALAANKPEVVFVNFCNYVEDQGMLHNFLRGDVVMPYRKMMGRDPVVLLGFGPKNGDVRVMQ